MQQEEQPSTEKLLLEIENLRQEVAGLRQEKADLEILLETTTEHSDTIEAELHKQAETVLVESEKRLQQFLEAMPIGVFVVDAQGKPFYANQRAEQLLGKGIAPETTAEKLSEVYQFYLSETAEFYPGDRQPLLRALQGESVAVDDVEIRQGNKTISVEVWATPIFNEKKEIIYAIAAFADITERKNAELELRKYTNQLFKLNQAYERFVPHEFLQFLNKKSIIDVELGESVEKEMSVLFSDIRGFTSLSESMSSEDSFKFINAYLSRMEPAIINNNGFIDKYIGDAIMALFSGSADDAVTAGITMLQLLNNYNQTRQRPGRAPIQIGIGINTGSLMLGTVGGKNRMDGTVISDTVNLAARLEELTESYGVSFFISHHTFLELKDSNNYCIRIIDRVKVKGKSDWVSIYEVFDGDPLEVRQGKLATRISFEQGLLLFHQDNYVEAEIIFSECVAQNPKDKTAHIYLERCQENLAR
ncbi:MAG: adenylate/guanylate cyclase domain-containing protein [Spirulinaceae cyanobacterium]